MDERTSKRRVRVGAAHLSTHREDELYESDWQQHGEHDDVPEQHEQARNESVLSTPSAVLPVESEPQSGVLDEKSFMIATVQKGCVSGRRREPPARGGASRSSLGRQPRTPWSHGVDRQPRTPCLGGRH